MRRRTRLVAFAVAAAMLLAAIVAFAQQPQPQPRPLQPGRPPAPGALPPGFPGAHPGVPGMPGTPTKLGPNGKPVPIKKPRPRAQPEPEEASAGEHECMGEGPDDPPPAPNWWHGILMVNNERAEKGGFVNHLLFRYENERDKCDPKNEPPPFLAAVLNIAIFGFVVARFGKKPLAEALAKRRADIMGEIDTATRLKEEAEARLAEYESKLENIHETMEQIRADFAAESEREKDHILAEAEERRARMRRDAEFRVEQELKAARLLLLQEAVDGAVGAAEDLVASRVNASDQDRIADAYLASLGAALQTRGAVASSGGAA